MPTNLSSLTNAQIQEYLNNKSLKIGVIGIGRIGLPTALCIANSGLETIGIDINEKLVENESDIFLKKDDDKIKDGRFKN